MTAVLRRAASAATMLVLGMWISGQATAQLTLTPPPAQQTPPPAQQQAPQPQRPAQTQAPPAQQRPAQTQAPPAQQRPQAQPAQQRPAPAAAPAEAFQLPPAGTAIVVADVNQIMRDSSAVKSIRDAVEGRRQAYQTEFSRQETALRNADQELARQRASLSPEDFAAKRRDLEKRVADAQQAVANRRRILDDAFNESMTRVNQTMVEVVSEIAIERQYQMILPKTQVIIVQTALDITPEVLARLNRKLPSVKVNFPAN